MERTTNYTVEFPKEEQEEENILCSGIILCKISPCFKRKRPLPTMDLLDQPFNHDSLSNEFIEYIEKMQFSISNDHAKELFEFCYSLTKEYDESHNIEHHTDVFKNALNILSQLKLDEHTKKEWDRLFQLILYTTMLHDTIDHKYPKNMEYKRISLCNFLEEHIPSSKTGILWIIDNISYSKEVKFGYPINTDQIIQLARNIVSDADKLESIGDIGIIRCYQYAKASNPTATNTEITKLVVQHCHDKLLKIKDDFIRTEPGIIFALSAHQVIVNFVNKHEID